MKMAGYMKNILHDRLRQDSLPFTDSDCRKIWRLGKGWTSLTFSIATRYISAYRSASDGRKRRKMDTTGQWIPWQDREEWSQVVMSIPAAVANIGGEVNHLREIALRIKDLYSELDGLFDSLVARTCCNCTTICCTVATVWYDLRDILFLYLADSQLPRHQITRNADRTCVNLTPQGCCLNRRKRPFICTWYVCATQKDVLLRQEHGAGKEIFTNIAQLKTARNELENRFVEAVG